MSVRRILSVSFFIAALHVNTTLAEPPAPKDGPLGMKFVLLPKGLSNVFFLLFVIRYCPIVYALF